MTTATQQRKLHGTHRGPGEGSIYRLKDGRWRGQVFLGYRQDDPRKHRYKIVEARTRAEVQRRVAEVLRLKTSGIDLSAEQTLTTYLDTWLKDSVKPSVRHSTWSSYEGYVRNHIKPALGKGLLTELTPLQVKAFLAEKQEQVSARTAQYIHAILRAALQDACRMELVDRNVAKLVRPPRLQHREVAPLTPTQAMQLLAYLQSTEDRMSAFYTLAVSAGLREGEALGLSWSDLDLERGLLAVNHTLQKVEREFQLLEPKTKRSRRTIHLPQLAIQHLIRHRARQQLEREFAGDRWIDKWNLVFTTSIGTPIDASRLNAHFRKVKLAVGLPTKTTIHSLRHTAAFLLIAQGVHPRQIMELLGHSTITLTMNTYGHVYASLGKEVASKMDQILTPALVEPRTGALVQ